jgi:hypothetical protein
LGQVLDTPFVKGCIPIDIKGYGNDQDDAGNKNDLEE